MVSLRHLQVGNRVRDRAGKEYEVLAVYNVETPAQQVLLSGEYFPMLVSEIEKLGYQYIYEYKTSG